MATKLIAPTTLFVIFVDSLVLYLSLSLISLYSVVNLEGTNILLDLFLLGNFIFTAVVSFSVSAAEIAETKNPKLWVRRSAVAGIISCAVNFVLFSIAASISGGLNLALALFLFVVYLAVALISSLVGSGLVVLWLKHGKK